MSRCAKNSFYLGPQQKLSFAACTLGVVDANGQLRIMRHRQDVVRFESRNPGGHTYWVAPAGGRTSLESALASGKATGFFGDDRTIAGHLPRDRAAFVVGKLASCQDQM